MSTLRIATALCSAALIVGLSLAGCSGLPSGGEQLDAPSSTHKPATDAQTGTEPLPVDKVLVFVLENHSLAQAQADMPYTSALADKYGYASNFTAVRHPSLPNYLAMSGGSTFGVTDDKGPGAHKITHRSVFGQAIAAGKTAAVYAESMSSNCQQFSGSKNGYAVRHNPWAYYTKERANCRKFDVPLAKALPAAVSSGSLPNAGMVIPNLCNDAHNCSLTVTDNWYKKWVSLVMDGPDFQSGRLAIVLTADENDKTPGNIILTVVIHNGTAAGEVTTHLSSYSIARLYSDVVGATPLAKAASTGSMVDAFQLPVAQ